MLANCPKCGHSPLPFDQALPAACPACGVILAKLAQTMSATTGKNVKLPVHSNQHNLTKDQTLDEPSTFFRYLFHTPERIDSFTIWIHLALLFGFAVWGLTLIAQDYRTGEMGAGNVPGSGVSY